MTKRVLITTLADDPHTQGLFKFTRLAREAGAEVVALPPGCSHAAILEAIQKFDPQYLGLSYRLSPKVGLEQVTQFIEAATEHGLLTTAAGQPRRLGFAGLPQTVDGVTARFGHLGLTGFSQSTSIEGNVLPVLDFLEVQGPLREKILHGAQERLRPRHLPVLDELAAEVAADFSPEQSLACPSPLAQRSYIARIQEVWPERPLLRVHYGEPGDSIAPTVAGIGQLAQVGVIDELSLGSSDLSQRYYGLPQEWLSRKNDGGVPYKNFDDLCALREAARCGNLPAVKPYCHVARSETFVDDCLRADMLTGAHQAVPLYWFNALDGRGNMGVRDSIAEHMQTVRKLTQHGIPVEMNDPNHWCSRWASDAVVVADYALIASVMRACGVQDMVLQMQFNKPKEMSDRGDLAKFMAAKEIAGAMLEPSTRLWLETRTGIEWLEPDLTLARQQLARSTLLQMFMNPHAIHIVSYCEALYAAKPADIGLASGVIRKAVRMFHRHETDLLKLLESDELQQRKHYLLDEAKYLLRQIASLNPAYHAKPNPPDIPPFNALADPDVLHQALVQGVMGAPGIFTEPYRQIANRMATDVMDGGVINPIDPVSLAPVNEAQRIALLHREPAA